MCGCSRSLPPHQHTTLGFWRSGEACVAQGLCSSGFSLWGSGLHSTAKGKGLPIFGVQMLGDCSYPLPGSGLGTSLQSFAEKPPHDILAPNLSPVPSFSQKISRGLVTLFLDVCQIHKVCLKNKTKQTNKQTNTSVFVRLRPAWSTQ